MWIQMFLLRRVWITQETEEEAQSGPTEEELRAQIVDFALQFEGNPYVYGGTSLTNGADCSGFVMSVFAQFGYSLPRVAADQYYQSVQKSVADLEPETWYSMEAESAM